MTVELSELRSWFGLGVAGNFAGHLEQAGEAADFVSVKTEGSGPKGIFPWYAPGSDTFLGEFPLSNDAIELPAETDGPLNLQIEPEVGLACRVVWQGDTVVTLLIDNSGSMRGQALASAALAAAAVLLAA